MGSGARQGACLWKSPRSNGQMQTKKQRGNDCDCHAAITEMTARGETSCHYHNANSHYGLRYRANPDTCTDFDIETYPSSFL